MSSVREQLLEAVVASFANMEFGGFAPGLLEAFTCTFAPNISRAPLNDLSWKSQYSLGIQDMEERKERKAMFYYCSLPVIIEFRYLRQADEDPSTELNRILYDIQRWLAIDYTWGGLAINTQETSNSFYIDDENEKKLHGAVMVTFTYRYFWNDPSRLY
jgi:hypothetical protein